jgi:hypothetical protein
MVTLTSTPAGRRWRLTAAALAVIGGGVLGVAMADASAAIMRSCLLCGGVVAIGLRAFRAARGGMRESREAAPVSPYPRVSARSELKTSSRSR